MRVVPLVALLLLSGLFSGSETALFSLDAAGRARAGSHARRILEHPRDLLLTVLLGNLFVNLLYFAAVPLLFPAEDAGDALLVGLGALVTILLAGEILPKTLALRAPLPVARLVAFPLDVLVRALGPVRRAAALVLDLLLRMTGETEKRERGITPETLAAALERSAAAGVLAMGEAELLADIVDLSALRVREIMTPRVDMLALDLEAREEERAVVLRDAVRRRVTWIPVVRGDADNVVGRLALRDHLADPDRPLEALVMPAIFIPEVARVLKMLHTLREERVAEAVVVDEWGGTAGVVTLEDLFEEIVGELRVEGEEMVRPFIPLGEGRFRVSGGLSVRDWNELLGRQLLGLAQLGGTQVAPKSFETVGGYVTALLGRIPRAGDRVTLGAGLVGEVREVRGRRVLTVDLTLEPAEVAQWSS